MAATDKELGDLHAEVAKGLTKILKEGVEVLHQGEGTGYIERPAAFFGAAIAFLKNNNITADRTKNPELDGLAKALADRRAAAKDRVNKRDLESAAEAFIEASGGMSMQ